MSGFQGRGLATAGDRHRIPPPVSDSTPDPRREGVTALLARVEAGDRAALDELFGVVYQELHLLAHRQLGRLRPGDTLSTTVLVHETFLKFVHADDVATRDRQHFYSLAARAMRQILVDDLRRRHAQRRPPGERAVSLADIEVPVAESMTDLLAVDAILRDLEKLDPALAQLVDWRVFAGLTLEEIAAMIGRSESSLKRDWQKARAFLARAMGPPSGSHPAIAAEPPDKSGDRT